MKNQKLLIITAVLMLFAPALCSAQARIYTKKARMDDFTAKTTKVVAAGQSLVALTTQEEIRSRWRCSPYEFCSPAEYNRICTDNNYYFLEFLKEDGVVFLSLSKGGKEDDADNRAKPFEVVRMPVASETASTGFEISFIGAAVDVIQQFALEAMHSDVVGYSGLKAYARKDLGNKQVILDPEKAEQALAAGTPDVLIGMVVAPSVVTFTSKCYKLLVSADTHELYYYSAERFDGPSAREFNAKDEALFTKRHGIISR